MLVRILQASLCWEQCGYGQSASRKTCHRVILRNVPAYSAATYRASRTKFRPACVREAPNTGKTICPRFMIAGIKVLTERESCGKERYIVHCGRSNDLR